MRFAEDEERSTIELQVLSIAECFIYKVPPLRSASGHRAEEWNLEKPLFTGCLKIFQIDVKLKIVVYTLKDQNNKSTSTDNIALFVECPIEVEPNGTIINFVDGVIDSSRYYVLRIKDPKSTRTALLGIGFRDRDQSFDFKNCLNDYVRFVTRMDQASKLSLGSSNQKIETQVEISDEIANSNYNAIGSNDSSNSTVSQNQTILKHIEPLKEGEKIKTNLKFKNKSNAVTSNSVKILPPPPKSNVVIQSNDDEWSDFTTSS